MQRIALPSFDLEEHQGDDDDAKTPILRINRLKASSDVAYKSRVGRPTTLALARAGNRRAQLGAAPPTCAQRVRPSEGRPSPRVTSSSPPYAFVSPPGSAEFPLRATRASGTRTPLGALAPLPPPAYAHATATPPTLWFRRMAPTTCLSVSAPARRECIGEGRLAPPRELPPLQTVYDGERFLRHCPVTCPPAKATPARSLPTPNTYSLETAVPDITPRLGPERRGRLHRLAPVVMIVALGAVATVAVREAVPRLDGAEVATLIATAQQPGVRLRVDGEEAGLLPVTMNKMPPGRHVLDFSISDRYSSERRVVDLGPSEMRILDPVSLKVVRGVASFDIRSAGATVHLISGDERRLVADPSRPIEIDTGRSFAIEVSKAGYQTLREPLTFENNAEKTFVVQLIAMGTEPAARAGTWLTARQPASIAALADMAAQGQMRSRSEFIAPTALPPVAAAQAPPSRKDTALASRAGNGMCTVSLNSLPPTNLALDGRPIGRTPQMGIAVPAGSHTVLFVGADDTRRTTFTCTSGSKKTVALRFSSSLRPPD